MPPLPLATQSRPADYAGERLINYSFDPSQNVTLGRRGLKEHKPVSGAVRAMGEANGRMYAAAGGTLWDVEAGTAKGNFPDDVATTMAEVGTNLCIVAGGSYYVFDGATVTKHPTGQAGFATSVASLDGYAVVSGMDGNRKDRIAVSEPNDPTTFAALDFATAEAIPDAVVRVIRDHTELAVIGARTIERFYNSGDVSPFSANKSAFAERGCQNGATVVAADNGLYWLGNDGNVYRSFGGQPEIVSTSVIAEWIAQHTWDGAFTVDDRGRKFYVLRRSDGPALALCLGTGLWSEFSTGGTHGAWIGSAAYMFNGVQYVGTTTGKICTFSGWEDDGQPVRAEVYSQPIRERVVPVGNIELQMDTGHGAARVDLQTSRDGRTWSMPRKRDMGKAGEYGRAARWHGCGTHRNLFQARINTTSPVQRDIHGVYYG